MARLKAEFEKNGGGFKEWKIGKLFEIKNTSSFNTDRLVEGYEYDYITRTSLNQGILQTTGFIDEEHINQSNCWSLGLLQMDFFYREKPWYAGQFVRKIIPKIEMNENIVLYFSVVLNKLKQKLLSVLVRSVDTVFLNSMVSLPTLSTGELAFDYMEAYIRELEEERVRELEEERVRELAAYLAASGLEDYHLTAAEQDAIDLLRNGKVEMREFRIGELISISTTKKKFNAIDVQLNGKHPYVVRTSQNNGIRGYITENDEYLNEANTISFGQDTATMFYQEEPYFTGDKIKIMKLKKMDFNDKIANYYIATMNKAFSNFSWGTTSFSEKVLNSVNITLPVLSSGEIDYTFMQHYISAVQKIAIKNVVLWKDRQIAATEKIVATAADRNGNAALSVCTKDSIANAL